MSAKTMIAHRIDRAVKRANRASRRKQVKDSSITKRAALALFVARQRGKSRRELAHRVGTYMLNEIEHGGQCSMKDYSTVTPRWVISYYLGIRRRGK